MMIGLVDPARGAGTFLQMIGFAEDHAAEDVADGAVRRPPHLLEVELLHAAFVRRDGRALHRNADLAVCSPHRS